MFGGTYNPRMGKAEILAELPSLKAEDRRQIFGRLCGLEEQDLLHGFGPTAEEKRLLLPL